MLNKGTEIQIEIFINPHFDRLGKGTDFRAVIVGEINYPVRRAVTSLFIQLVVIADYGDIGLHIVVNVIFYIHTGGYKYLAGAFSPGGRASISATV